MLSSQRSHDPQSLFAWHPVHPSLDEPELDEEPPVLGAFHVRPAQLLTVFIPPGHARFGVEGEHEETTLPLAPVHASANFVFSRLAPVMLLHEHVSPKSQQVRAEQLDTSFATRSELKPHSQLV